jgi:hypothetical protein
MAKNIILGNFSKTQDIGDTIGEINRSFKILDETVKDKKDIQSDINSFVSFTDDIYDKLNFCHKFMQENRFYLYDVWDEVVEKKEKFLKPIMVMYTEKIRNDILDFSQQYIENLLLDWVNTKYIILSKELDKPNYVEGQTINVYYLKAEENIIESLNNRDTATTTCIAKDVEVVVTCFSKRNGQACFDGCGCVSCGKTVTCKNTGQLSCYFTDSYLKRYGVERYLRSICGYTFEEYPDIKFDMVTYIVDDCVWKIKRQYRTGLLIEPTQIVNDGIPKITDPRIPNTFSTSEQKLSQQNNQAIDIRTSTVNIRARKS